MSTLKSRAHPKSNSKLTRRLILFMAIVLSLSLVGTVTNWRGNSLVKPRSLANFLVPTPSPSPVLTKEYIYAGSRLIATEEPTPAPTPTPTPTPMPAGNYSLSLAAGAYFETDSAANSSLDIRTNLTLEAWVKTDADTNWTTGTYRNVVVRGDKWNDGVFSYILRLADKKIRFDLGQADGSYVGLYSNTEMQANCWHHIAAVYDNGQMRVYLDGSLDGSMAFNWTPPAPPSGPTTTKFRIGLETNPSMQFPYIGLIDEVTVSNSARYSGTTISPPPPTQLSSDGDTRGLWKFDTQSGADSSGNNNTANANGSVSYSSCLPAVGSCSCDPPSSSYWSLSLNGTDGYLEATSAINSSLDIRAALTVEALGEYYGKY